MAKRHDFVWDAELYFRAGDTILDPSEMTRNIYCVKKGNAALQVFTQDDRPGFFCSFSDGDFIGLIEAFSDYSFPVSRIYALSDCTMCACSFENIQEQVLCSPELAIKLLKNISEQMIIADKWQMLQTTADVTERLIVIVAQHYESGTLGVMSKQMLANEICTPIRSLNRALAKVNDMISCKKKRLEVIEPAALLRAATEINQSLGL